MLYTPSGKWHWAGKRFSLLVDRRVTVLFLLLCLVFSVIMIVSLSVGSSPVAMRDIGAVLFGKSEPVTAMILFEIRLPRMVSASIAGFALGMAGCISQTVFRNRLATPDILGINEGATLAIVSFVLLTTTTAWPFWLAPVGALLAVVILYAFCSARTEHGAVLLVCGICLAEFMRAIIEFLMSMGALHEVQNIYVWLHGSFIGQGYQTSLPVLAVLLASLPVQFYLARHLEVLRLPSAIAAGLGVNVPALRLISIVTVAVLAALGASIAGPIAFVAMAAPILTAFFVKNHAPALWCSGLLGAGLLLLSDTLARSLADPQEIAVGVITRILGGFFLIYLLIRDGVR